VARATAESWATVPHFHLRSELDATALVEFREQFLGRPKEESGPRVSLTDLLLRALALSLRACPWANVVWRDGAPVELPAAAVGLVVSLDDGLLIPVIEGADRLEVVEVARRRAEVVAAAREGRLSAGAWQPAATSLSNLGHTRVDEFTPVLAAPQSTMLAVGRLAPRPFVVEGRLCARPTLRLTLAVDHRVMDGEPAARFLGRLVESLERPEMLEPGRKRGQDSLH
jgi:pyruvate dehydrogenase E2 component (dihydrolipoamide acetyltransferase)